MAELDEFLETVGALVKNLSPQERRALLRNLSVELRKRNAARVRANIEPAGSAMEGRNGDRWQMRGLKEGQSLRLRQKFNYFKERGLSLAYQREEGGKIIGRLEGEPRRLSSYRRDDVYFKGRSSKPKKMYQKMARAKYLRSKNTADEAVIGFLGGITAKIAVEHHYGESSKNLPARELIGLSAEDLEYVKSEILKAVSKGI